MLVLTRKRSEMIQIGEGIVIKIIHTGRNTVKLGIQAPADVRVMRAELCEPDAPPTLAQLLAERKMAVKPLEAELETSLVLSGVSSV